MGCFSNFFIDLPFGVWAFSRLWALAHLHPFVALLLLPAIHVMAISIQDHWAFLGLLFVFLSNGLISPLGPLAMSAYRLSCPIYFLLGILDPF